VDYENELNLLWTSAEYSISEEATESYLRFHDNNTGKNVKDILLKQPFNESLVNSAFLYLQFFFTNVRNIKYSQLI
jgi:hypothetical protein